MKYVAGTGRRGLLVLHKNPGQRVRRRIQYTNPSGHPVAAVATTVFQNFSMTDQLRFGNIAKQKLALACAKVGTVILGP